MDYKKKGHTSPTKVKVSPNKTNHFNYNRKDRKMGAVKWIKIVTDIFDDEKMLLIESLPSSDAIIVIWFKLLCLAGKIIIVESFY